MRENVCSFGACPLRSVVSAKIAKIERVIAPNPEFEMFEGGSFQCANLSHGMRVTPGQTAEPELASAGDVWDKLGEYFWA